MLSSRRESQMAKKLLDSFQMLNVDIASKTPALQSKRTLLELVLESTDKTALKDLDELLDTLQKETNRAVFYIFDEHDELFKEQTSVGRKSFLNSHPEFLNQFTRWTEQTGGVSFDLKDIDINYLLILETYIHNVHWFCFFKMRK